MRNLRTKAAKALGNQMSEHWDLSDPAAQTLLGELLDCFDRLQRYKAVLAKCGPICRDRFGQEKISPAFLAVRDETVTFSRLLKALNLEIEDQDNRPGRPNGFQRDTKYGTE
jgi:hypothetical protein